MIIYYNDNYGAAKGESHRLLEQAITAYISEYTGGCRLDSANGHTYGCGRDSENGHTYDPGYETASPASGQAAALASAEIAYRALQPAYPAYAEGTYRAMQPAYPASADGTYRALQPAASSGYAAELVSGMKTGAQGKPYIEGFLPFSISHSGNVWAVLFADRECGLDIQHEREIDMLAISRRWFDPADAEQIARAAFGDTIELSENGLHRPYNDLKSVSNDRSEDVSNESLGGRHEFFRIWARREAYAKAIGGSAFDSDLPAVSGDIIRRTSDPGRDIKGGYSEEDSEKYSEEYSIEDIRLPGMPDMHAAVCLRMAPVR